MTARAVRGQKTEANPLRRRSGRFWTLSTCPSRPRAAITPGSRLRHRIGSGRSAARATRSWRSWAGAEWASSTRPGRSHSIGCRPQGHQVGEFASEAELIRFQNEAEAVARARPPAHRADLRGGPDRGPALLQHEAGSGGSLDKRLGDFAADFKASARLVATVAEAIHHAHQRGILHRDLKPANILLDEQGEPHVTDFGLARRIETESGLTHSGYPMGTPSYMSPEQVRGEKDRSRTATDVYGLGSILYALLTGHAPFVRQQPGGDARQGARRRSRSRRRRSTRACLATSRSSA